jgi:hypothetical protein
MRRISLFLSVALLGIAFSSPAEARTERKLTYRASQIWNSAVRFLRVDMSYKIIEKDKETGYLLFEYKDGGRAYQASFELIPAVTQGRKIVRARMRIQGMPSYVEAVLIDRFLRKLRNEYGAPPPAELAVPDKPEKAGGAAEKSADAVDEGEGAEDEEDLEVDEEKLEESAEEDD